MKHFYRWDSGVMSPVKQRLLDAIENIPDFQVEKLLVVVETWGSSTLSSTDRRAEIASIFDRIAQLKPSITDPIAWQNEIRQERVLPGRSE